LYMLLFYLYTL